MTPAANAAIGLPYDYKVDYISGGGSGVSTDKFYMNSGGKICITSAFKTKKMKDSGAAPDQTYFIRLFRNDTWGDTQIYKWTREGGGSTYKTYAKSCVTGLVKNEDYHFEFKKDVNDSGTLTGYGTISYS